MACAGVLPQQMCKVGVWMGHRPRRSLVGLCQVLESCLEVPILGMFLTLSGLVSILALLLVLGGGILAPFLPLPCPGLFSELLKPP